jgi:Ca2+/Na+ antiporter
MTSDPKQGKDLGRRLAFLPETLTGATIVGLVLIAVATANAILILDAIFSAYPHANVVAISSLFLGIIICVGLVPAVLVFVRAVRVRRLRHQESGHRQSCGYNLTGNVSGICPECGTPIEAEKGKSCF